MRTRHLTLILAALSVAACGGDDTAPTATSGAPVTSADLEGRTLVATGVTEAGTDKALVDGTELRVSFDEPGGIGVNAGCNGMFGPYALEDGTLTAPNLASTMMACDQERMEQDAWISGLLAEGVDVAVAGDTVTFTGGDTVITLADRETVSPDLPLTGTTWTLSELVDAEAVSSVPGGVVATLSIAADGSYQVETGCNTGAGTAAVGETTIDFGIMRLTERACADDDAQMVETAMTTVLGGEVGFEIVERSLRLTKGDDGLGFTGS